MRRSVAFAVVVAGLVLAACRNATPAVGQLGRVDDPLPALSGEAVDGGRVGASDYEGRVVVVNFWASWCAPCREEQPELSTLWDELGGPEFAVVGVNYMDDLASAREYVREFDVAYPSLADPSGRIAHNFAVFGLPATFVADAAGVIRYQVYGQLNPRDLRAAVDGLLDGAG